MTRQSPRHRNNHSRRRLSGSIVVLVIIGLIAYGVLHFAKGSQAKALNTTSIATNRTVAVSDGYQPPAQGPTINGSFETLNGEQQTLSSYRGHALMVWFIAGGCASCAISIPAVANQLHVLANDGITVLPMGLSGDFGPSEHALDKLEAFAKSAAGKAFHDTEWKWGMASAALSHRYDAAGIPDYYLLVDSHGVITYQNTAPVATIKPLLRAAAKI
ncbi:hypothetical protein [Ferrimicrobium sp.]|uniref:peroxiredoxin family protein n=1 Tax=Ferrimicrobium sp. TaxID=2926050 RepID=UPI00260D6881|nr:hypothetical protein [Ferrimicrobium sp.]